MKLTELSIKRPIMITMVLMIMVLLGAFAFFDMPIDLFPSVNIPVVTVTTIYPGASPDEIKNSITKVIEDEVSSLSGIKKVLSYSLENVSMVVIEFTMDNDVDIVAQDVRDKIEAIKYKLPTDAKEPFVLKYDLNSKPIMEFVLSGPYPIHQLYDYADKEIKNRISRINGVANVELIGGSERIIKVELDKKKIAKYGLNIDDVVKMIKANNLDIPAGNFDLDAENYTVRVKGKIEQIDKLSNIMLITRNGNIKLSQIADIKDSFDKLENKTHYFNLTVPDKEKFSKYNSIGINVLQQTESNTIKTAAKILSEVEKINSNMKLPNTQLYLITDRSDFIRSSVNDTASNIFMGIALTALVLLLFLHNIRTTLIAAVVIPISYISAFFLMKSFGFSLNMLSLAGFSVTVGVLVTNTVIVLENIVRYIKTGVPIAQASEKGTSEIAVAVAASALTNVVVFVPISLMHGLVGQFFTEFGITVVIVTLISLFVSFTLTPMMSAKMLTPENIEKKGKFGRWFDNKFHSLEIWYKNSLKSLLNSRPKRIVLFVVVITLFILSILLTPKTGLEFIPELDQGELEVRVQFPLETNLDKTAEMLTKIEDYCKNIPEVKSIFTQAGIFDPFTKGPNVGKVGIRLVPKGDRDFKIKEFINNLRIQLIDYPGAEISVISPRSFGPDEPSIVLRLKGTNLDTLYMISKKIKTLMDTIPGCVDTYIGYKTGKPEIKIIPDMNKLSDYGITVYHLAIALRGAIEGIEASNYREEGFLYDIKVKYRTDLINDPDKIGYIPIKTQKGLIKVKDVARIKFGTGPTKIVRLDRAEMIEIKANISKRTLGEIIMDIKKGIDNNIKLPDGYSYIFAGDMEFLEDAIKDIIKAAIMAVLLTFMVLAALLESYAQATLIMVTLPLSLIGVIPSLVLTGTTFSVPAMIAMIMLIGIVVNNAILILDYTNQLRRNGMGVDEALLEVCPLKLKPILMSTFAIILGMLPLALATGAASEARAPIGIVSVGGLFVTTILTLFVIPIVYKVYETHKEKKEIKNV